MKKTDHIEIINKDNLEPKYIIDEIHQIEEEKGRTVIKAEFIDNGDGTSTQRFWFSKKPAFERLRRVSGYLVGSIEKMNNAKQSEVKDRLKHITSCDSTEGR